MPANPSRVRDVFLAAVELPPDRRVEFLADACGPDARLRAEVERLLAAHADPASLLDPSAPSSFLGDAPGGTTVSAGDVPVTADHPTGAAGGVLAGRYVLLERIGGGGMGEVWVAKQTEPVTRKVAVKLIKAGMDSDAVLARFEAERQALALMDHPNIARVFDGGLTDKGRPFFVMELVNGLPLTRFCDEARLTPRERLELFVPVCQAVQHAHQKGIVHRDLKPSNVLVTLYDGKPVPKVIDFGVAKATGGKLTDMTVSTQFGAVVGTLEYMAPEQAGYSALDVDTRADIYSLGVILYELLTGLRPFDAKRLKKAAFDEVLRIIREEEPPRPSTRLSTDESLPSLAAVRQTDPKRLTALMSGELDWVVMRCLEKDRGRRYETANALSRDVQRYLADEPVEARPPSRGYRLRKFVRRHRGPVLAAGLVFLALVGGIVGTTLGMIEARRQEGIALAEAMAKDVARQAEAERAAGEQLAKVEAQDQRTKALEAAAAATAAKEQAQKRLKQVERANAILGSIFESLDPREIARADRPLQAILVEKLDRAVEQLQGEAIGDQLDVAAMQNRLGRSLLGLSEPNKAIGLFEKARTTRLKQLGPDHTDTLAVTNNLAESYRQAGKPDLALPLYEETMKFQRARFGPEHQDTLIAMTNLALGYVAIGKWDQAVPLQEEALRLMQARHGPNHPYTLTVTNNLATAYYEAGNLDRALPLLEEVLKRFQETNGPIHPNTLTATNNLAGVYRATGKPDQALPLYESALKLAQAKLGPDHINTLFLMGNLGECHLDLGKPDPALPLLEESLTRAKARLGPDHPFTIAATNNLARGYGQAGDVHRALTLYEEALKRYQAKFGPVHPQTLAALNNVGLACVNAGFPDRAVPLLEEAVTRRKARLGADHPDLLASMNNLALAYSTTQRLDRALPLWEETLKLRQAKLGADHPATLTSLSLLGSGYRDAGQLDRALPLLQEAAAGIEKRRFAHEHAGIIVNRLIGCYEQLGQFDRAEAWRRKWLSVVKERSGADSVPYAAELAALGPNLLRQEKWAAAEATLRDCLALREKVQPDAWNTFTTRSMLGGALLGQKRYADAEPLLLAGYDGMKKRERTIPPPGLPRLPEAVDRLVELYTAMGKPEEGAKWRAERAKYPEVAPPPRPIKR